MDVKLNTQHQTVFKDIQFKNNKKSNKAIPKAEIKKTEKDKEKLNVPVLISTIVGSLIPLLVIRKYQGKSVNLKALKNEKLLSKITTIAKSFAVKYNLKEMLLFAVGSITGGLTGGLLFDKEHKKKPKIKEAIFQLNNIAIPLTLVTGLLKLTEKSKHLNGALPKIGAIALGLFTGMPIALKATNTINNNFIDKDHKKNRQLKLKDTIVHADDMVAAMTLAKVPLLDKVPIEQSIPILYAISGYKAGAKTNDKIGH